MVEMVIPSALERPEVEGSLVIVPVGTDPWADPVPIFVGSSEEAEEAHWAIQGRLGRLAKRSLRMALRILTEDLPNTAEVSPFLFSQNASSCL
jgi:hypothetical protein